jgi:hypothetical protein
MTIRYDVNELSRRCAFGERASLSGDADVALTSDTSPFNLTLNQLHYKNILDYGSLSVSSSAMLISGMSTLR